MRAKGKKECENSGRKGAGGSMATHNARLASTLPAAHSRSGRAAALSMLWYHCDGAIRGPR